MLKKGLLFGIAVCLAAAVACGGDSKTPVSPSPAATTGGAAAADGSTMKVTAPTPTSPAAAEVTADLLPTLTAKLAAGKFVTVSPLVYRFQVVDAAGSVLVNVGAIAPTGADLVTYKVATALTYNTPYRWRVRAEQDALVGPWSAYADFKTPDTPPPPTPVQPVGGEVTVGLSPLLIARLPAPVLANPAGLTFRINVLDPAGTVVVNAGNIPFAGNDRISYKVTIVLAWNTVYRWRVRTETTTLPGLWSDFAEFRTPEEPKDPFETPGYIKPNEIWDPLTKGVSVGIPVNMEFVPGQGARTVSNESRIRYGLLQTLETGEYSFYVYNLNPLSANNDKSKLMSMAEGDGDITTNDYRFTVEKRGVMYPAPGQVRIRIINGDSGNEENIHDSAPEVPPFVKGIWYFVRLTWGGNQARLQIYETDPKGDKIADIGVDYPGRQYRPNPHVAYIGAPVGRGGPQDASVTNMTVKGVFIGGPGAKRPGLSGDIDIDR